MADQRDHAVRGGSRQPPRLESERLVLRAWRAEDREPFAAINADPMVMEFITGGVVSRRRSDELAAGIERGLLRDGYGLFAAEVRATGEFVGFIGIHHHPDLAPHVEIGWRLASHVWGLGMATEGARTVRDFAFQVLHLPTLVSATVLPNVRSARVMQKIGMYRWKLVPGEPHTTVVYRMDNPDGNS